MSNDNEEIQKLRLTIEQLSDQMIRSKEQEERTLSAFSAINNELVTLQRQLAKNNASLEVARQQAVESDESKSAFMAVVSHDFRTPLNGILGMAELLALSPLSDEQKNSVNVIQEAAKLLLKLLQDLLDLSKLQAGQMRLEHGEVKLQEILDQISQLLQPQIEKTGNRLLIDYDAKVASVLQGDSTRLTQVLINLIQNANKFTTDGLVEVRVKLLKQQAHHAQLIRFEVQDTGIGISEADQARLFEPYVQTEQGRAKKYEGTGLGLSICKSLVTLMNGQIGIRSKEGQGSTFWFEIELGVQVDKGNEAVQRAAGDGTRVHSDAPSHDDSCAPSPGFPDASEKASFSLPILLADDNAINRQLVQLQLKKLGFTHVECVSNGEQALDAFRHTTYSLILMDSMMPVMDGIEAARQIRMVEQNEMREPTPIIAMTGNVMKSEQDRCYAAGMNDFIGKPCTLDVLGAAIRKWHAASKPVEILNMNVVREIAALNTDGNETLLVMLLEMYRAETPGKIEDLRRHVVSADHAAAVETAHDLKSGSLSLGISYLSSLFSQIEEYAKKEQTHLAEPLLDKLLPAYQAACAALRQANPN
ncbi:response regulator [Paenibacillus barcinonensis]|uniref:Circadian input-output histidine kinase CikA n=1 Tax=Paenibacillus barcinonensis TaxID=198119 RepID=A0A2V4VX13_PAEBA|nr:ATP-binding protein [Paenibacillus barcinonensis]PYE52275.1 signal transduction histidine kinase [Paenibacillus barcinonensis]QKS59597.1 response regulator [Paenibacillus barcinonensis]